MGKPCVCDTAHAQVCGRGGGGLVYPVVGVLRVRWECLQGEGQRGGGGGCGV